MRPAGVLGSTYWAIRLPRTRRATRAGGWPDEGVAQPGGGRANQAGQAGQGLVEYGLILLLIAVVCVGSLLFFGDQLSSLLSLIGSAA